MYEELIKIRVSFSEFGKSNLLVIDKNTNAILFNGKCKTLSSNEFYRFLDDFLRIVRVWTSNTVEENFNNDFILNMTIYENKKEYDYFIKKIPDNFDSFFNLINEIEF